MADLQNMRTKNKSRFFYAESNLFLYIVSNVGRHSPNGWPQARTYARSGVPAPAEMMAAGRIGRRAGRDRRAQAEADPGFSVPLSAIGIPLSER